MNRESITMIIPASVLHKEKVRMCVCVCVRRCVCAFVYWRGWWTLTDEGSSSTCACASVYNGGDPVGLNWRGSAFLSHLLMLFLVFFFLCIFRSFFSTIGSFL